MGREDVPSTLTGPPPLDVTSAKASQLVRRETKRAHQCPGFFPSSLSGTTHRLSFPEQYAPSPPRFSHRPVVLVRKRRRTHCGTGELPCALVVLIANESLGVKNRP